MRRVQGRGGSHDMSRPTKHRQLKATQVHDLMPLSIVRSTLMHSKISSFLPMRSALNSTLLQHAATLSLAAPSWRAQHIPKTVPVAAWICIPACPSPAGGLGSMGR